MKPSRSARRLKPVKRSIARPSLPPPWKASTTAAGTVSLRLGGMCRRKVRVRPSTTMLPDAVGVAAAGKKQNTSQVQIAPDHARALSMKVLPIVQHTVDTGAAAETCDFRNRQEVADVTLT